MPTSDGPTNDASAGPNRPYGCERASPARTPGGEVTTAAVRVLR